MDDKQKLFWFWKERSPWKWVALILAIVLAFILLFDVRIGAPHAETEFKKEKSEILPPRFQQKNEVNCGF